MNDKDKRAAAWFRSLNGDGSLGIALLLLLAVLAALELLFGARREALYYERAALQAGQWWRLASAHWIHLDLRHLLFNAAGLVLLWVLFARQRPLWQWAVIALAAMLAIDAGLWWFEPQVQWYAGASGWLHGVLAVGAVTLLWRERDGFAWLLAGVVVAKLLAEQWRGASVVIGDLPVVVDAHLFGAAGGLAAAVALALRRKSL